MSGMSVSGLLCLGLIAALTIGFCVEEDADRLSKASLRRRRLRSRSLDRTIHPSHGSKQARGAFNPILRTIDSRRSIPLSSPPIPWQAGSPIHNRISSDWAVHGATTCHTQACARPLPPASTTTTAPNAAQHQRHRRRRPLRQESGPGPCPHPIPTSSCTRSRSRSHSSGITTSTRATTPPRVWHQG